MDPQQALASLVGCYPRVEIDVCGAGDHLDKVDTKIHHIQKLMRLVVAGLPFRLDKARWKDLRTYAMN